MPLFLVVLFAFAAALSIIYWRHAALVASFITIVLGCIIGAVSYGQWKISDAQLRIAEAQRHTNEESRKQDLFDKRYEIFNEIFNYFSFIPTYKRKDLEDMSFKLSCLSVKARFLFDEKVYEFVSDMRDMFLNKAAAMRGLGWMLHESNLARDNAMDNQKEYNEATDLSSTPEERAELIEKLNECDCWFISRSDQKDFLINLFSQLKLK